MGSMKRLRIGLSHIGVQRSFSRGLAVAIAAVFSAMLTPATASAAVLGPPDFARWCNWKNGTNVLYSAGPLNLWDAYSWRCTLPPGIPTIGIDANSACTLKYGRGATAFTTNPGWAHSWQCRR